jgi:hypothetical protein
MNAHPDDGRGDRAPQPDVRGAAAAPSTNSEQGRLVGRFASLAPLAVADPRWHFTVVGHTWQLRLDSLVEPSRARDLSGNIRVHIACGAAVEFARLALRSLGYAATVRLTPRADDVSLLATLTEGHRQDATIAEKRLIGAITESSDAATRHEVVVLAAPLLAELHEQTADRGCWLRVLDDSDHEISRVAGLLTERAPEEVHSSPAYQSVGMFVLLGTDRDDPQSWLRVGRSLASLVLALAAHGLVAYPLPLVSEAPAAAVQLRRQLRLIGTPQVLVRVEPIRDLGPRPRPEPGQHPVSTSAA